LSREAAGLVMLGGVGSTMFLSGALSIFLHFKPKNCNKYISSRHWPQLFYGVFYGGHDLYDTTLPHCIFVTLYICNRNTNGGKCVVRFFDFLSAAGVDEDLAALNSCSAITANADLRQHCRCCFKARQPKP
jgi:hypothetical protein